MNDPAFQNDGVPRPGDLLSGKYEVEGVLGAGGMGVVVAARHLDLGQRVAIKVLNPAFAKHKEATARFLREARAASRIQSEHVARVHDVARLENGAPYMVMEHLTGKDLDKVVGHGALPIEEAIDYVLQACEAIAEAHALGIVHRDLKPANLFLTHRADGSPLVKVLDFGMSKVIASEGGVPEQNLTATSAVLGSPLYMSPEQVRSSKTIDARSDVWSLGVILHKLLTSQQVFAAETLSSCLAKIVADPPARLRDARPDAPAELEAVILRCLEKDVTRRIQNVAEFAWALSPFAPQRSRLSIERIVKVLLGTDVLTEKTLPLSSAASAPFSAAPTGSVGESSAESPPPPVAVAVMPPLEGIARSVASSSIAAQPRQVKGAARAVLIIGGLALVAGCAVAVWRAVPWWQSNVAAGTQPTPAAIEIPLPPAAASVTAAASVQDSSPAQAATPAAPAMLTAVAADTGVPPKSHSGNVGTGVATGLRATPSALPAPSPKPSASTRPAKKPAGPMESL